jgi:hypothetical protein
MPIVSRHSGAMLGDDVDVEQEDGIVISSESKGTRVRTSRNWARLAIIIILWMIVGWIFGFIYLAGGIWRSHTIDTLFWDHVSMNM